MATGTRSTQGWIWTGAAVIAVLAFMLWLGAAAEPSVPVTVNEDTTAADGQPAATGEAVALADLVANPTAYQGRTIEVRGALVQAKVGEQAFFVEGPGQTPFLVKAGDAAMASPAQAGARVDVVGVILPRTDSVLEAWKASGAIVGAGQEGEAQFAQMFLEASRVSAAQGGATP